MATRKKRKQKGPYRHRELGPRQAEELEEISAVLDEHPELERAVTVDLERDGTVEAPRSMPPSQVLRAFVVKDINRWSYEELEYPLADSRTYRRFCGTDPMFPDYYRVATLEAHLERISEETIAALHRVLVQHREG